MDLNPLVAREVRSRWRSPRAFGLILAYAAILTLAMVGSYGYSRAHLQDSQSHQRLAVLGHHMFQTLTWMQTLAWLLIAPALTATSIAAERERGLLESMQLSRLTPRHVVTGKLLAALSFMLLLTLVPLPIVATCFIIGGVSPGEFALATLLQVVTAINCAVMGLFCSAWSRRAGEALRAAFALVLLWAITSGIAFPIAIRVWRAVAGSTPIEMLRLQLATLYAYTNPVLAVYTVTDPSIVGTGGPSVLGLSTWVLALPVWAVCLTAQVLGAAILLALAKRGVEQPWDAATGSDDVAWHRPPAAQAPGDRLPSPAMPNGALRPQFQSGVWELPLAHSLRFANPVLQRELLSRLRSRQPDRVMLTLEGGIALLLLYAWARAMGSALLVPDARGGLWWGICNLLLLITLFTSALLGAATFTRERETGTWEGIQLSLLSPATIIAGKLMTPLLVCALLSVPFWPILLLCIQPLHSLNDASDQSIWFRTGVTLIQVAAALAVVAAAAWCYTAWGMLLSWRCRNTSAATGWVIGTLFVPLIVVPAAAGILPASSRLQALLAAVHPFYALQGLMYDRYPVAELDAGSLTAAVCVALHLALGVVLLLVLYRSMQRGVRRRHRPERRRNARLAFNV